MIYTLTKEFSKKELVQWYDIIHEQSYLDIKNIKHFKQEDTSSSFEDYLGSNEFKNWMGDNITNEDVLLMDENFILKEVNNIDPEKYAKQSIKVLNEYPFKKIYIFSKDLPVDERFNTEKITVFSSNIYNRFEGLLKSIPNYYLLNAGFSSIRDVSFEMFSKFDLITRNKKFISLNGAHKAHRIYLYHFLERENILKDTFFSYMAYDIAHRLPLNKETEIECSFENTLVNPIDEEIKNHIDKDRYFELVNTLPIKLDSDFGLHNFTLYPPLPYSTNAYFEIVTTSKFGEGQEGSVYLDEKSFRPFLSFTIPIFIAQPHTLETLRNYGFDLFDDIINYGDDDDSDINRLTHTCDMIKKISEYSIEEMDLLYKKSRHRLLHNFTILRELSEMQIKSFIKRLLPQEKSKWI